MAGFVVNLPDPTSKPVRQVMNQFTLPSGKEVVIYRGKGRDLRLALMAAGANADQFRILFAITARLATVDGDSITLEGIDDMDLEDVLVLQGEAGKVLNPLLKLKTDVAMASQLAEGQPKIEVETSVAPSS